MSKVIFSAKPHSKFVIRSTYLKFTSAGWKILKTPFKVYLKSR